MSDEINVLDEEAILKEYYFDNSATTKIDPDALTEMNRIYTKVWGNPSSYHQVGFEAEEELDKLKQQFAELLNIKENEIYFTSGGTESNNWAVKGGARFMKRKYNKNVILCSSLEHPSIINSCESLKNEGFIVEYIKAKEDGVISISDLQALLDHFQDKVAVVCVMRANNETGTVENKIELISDMIHDYNALFVCDAVQALGKIDHGQIAEYGADLVSFSAHKFHGPKGVGGLYIKDGIEIDNLIDGGGQQNNLRSGTEALALIAGMYIALRNSLYNEDNFRRKANASLYYLIEQLRIYCDNDKYPQLSRVKTSIKFNGVVGIPGVLNVSFKDINGDMLQIALNDYGIYTSTGSACHSNVIGPSHVLSAMNVPQEYILGTLRFSLDDKQIEDNDLEIDYIIDKIILCLNRITRMKEQGIIN